MKRTLVDLFENSVKQYPDNPFLWEKTTNKFEPTTYTQVREQVYTLGAGLVALGVMKGDSMALLSEGRNAWIIGELAMFYAGATNVPLSIKLEEANDLLFRLLQTLSEKYKEVLMPGYTHWQIAMPSSFGLWFGAYAESLVDDMLLDLQLFELKCADMPDFEIVGKFTDPNAAIEYAAGHVVDFALLDIDMPGMDGIHLAQALRRLRSDIIIVFATAHPKFAVEALKMKADYIIFKPFDREDIADVMERAKLLRRRQCKRIHFHTFGAFDMLVDGEPVHFRSGKAKELMALCVYRDGRPVSIHEIVEYLWGENADGTGYRRTIKELADTLRDYGAEEMFLRSRGSLRVRMDLADSDFQAFMSGDEDAICQFQGVFMQQYSWAEPMVCTLQEKKELMLARMGKHRM